MQHEPVGQRLGQRGDGELLLIAHNRADCPQGLPDKRPGSGDVFDHVERFYNPTRRHSTIVYVSPMEFERIAAGGLKVVSVKPAAAHN
jgi:hypothetical protein